MNGKTDNQKLDDPKWTAYVLGELSDPERTAVEAELRADPAARALVNSIRIATERLTDELRREPAPKLERPLAHSLVEAATTAASSSGTRPLLSTAPSPLTPQPRFRPGRWLVGGCIATSVALLVTALLVPATQSARELARRSNSSDGSGYAAGVGGAVVQQSQRMHEIAPTSGSAPRPQTPFNRSGGAPRQELSALGAQPSEAATSLSVDTASPTDDLRHVADGAEVNFARSRASNEYHAYRKKPADSLRRLARVELKDKLADQPVREEELVEAGIVLHAGRVEREHNTEAYDHIVDNRFLTAADNPLSTFSIDVDTASYSNVRRFLMQQNQLPPRGAVRIEELINYFRYDYPQPEGEHPFSVTTEVAACPWQPENRLVRIGLKGKEIAKDKRPPTNLVFLIDVSGSMDQPNKLPLVQQSFKLLTQQLTENDRVAIVVYAGSSGMVLPSTTGDQRSQILDAIERLSAGGSTNGGEGIQLAYDIAAGNLIKGGVNRVILATDGDFNVGVTNLDDLVRLIEDKAKSGVFLTAMGFGMGNIKDSTLEKLADKGNGNYAYIDDLPEARKVLVEQINGTLVTIAKDVKIQVEFNPAEVESYRLIGYENRVLAKEDFNDDKKDAGEIGAGHTVTALYEFVPAKLPSPIGRGVGGEGAVDVGKGDDVLVDQLKYQRPVALSDSAKTGELFTIKLRYKQPDGDKSTLMQTPVPDSGKKFATASADFKFAAAVAGFGMIFRDSPHKGNATLSAVEELAHEGLGTDDGGYRAEFLQLVARAKTLKGP